MRGFLLGGITKIPDEGQKKSAGADPRAEPMKIQSERGEDTPNLFTESMLFTADFFVA